ncbi:MAG: UDP-N-acetylmuramate dehydrogenase [Candidatus Omnitrophota bacterium]
MRMIHCYRQIDKFHAGYKNWCGGEIKLKEPLKGHTTFKIGGAADYFIEPKDINDLKLLLNLLKRYNISFLIIGAGSNILVSDQGISGAVIHLNSPYFKKIFFEADFVEVRAGCYLSRFISAAGERGLSGCEFLSGIPGTAGGALIMNAGQSREGRGFGDLVETATVMDDNGIVKTLLKKDLRFAYRRSNLAKYIILSAGIRLIKKNKKEIQNRIKEYLDYRRGSQDLIVPSAGCIFKNPAGNSAGKLIDLCGLKNRRIGDAGISSKHANFILNMGNADSESVLRLMRLIKKQVRARFNIVLKPEIKIWR